MLRVILKVSRSSSSQIKPLIVQHLVFLNTRVDILGIELRKNSSQGLVLNVNRPLSTLNPTVLHVFNPGKRLLQLGLLRSDSLSHKLLYSFPLCSEAEA